MSEPSTFRFALSCAEQKAIVTTAHYRTFTNAESDAVDDPGWILTDIRLNHPQDFAHFSKFTNDHSGGNCHIEPCFLSVEGVEEPQVD